MDVFKDNEHKVYRVTMPSGAMPASIRMRNSAAGSQFLDEQQFAVITGIDYSMGTNYQLTQSLEDINYLYTFGDKPGNVVVKGIAFPASCKDKTVGIDGMLKFYADNKISARVNGEVPQIQIQVSTTSITGYLVECAISLSDPVTRISTFVLQLKVTD